jgi:hypothetical protein
MQNGKQESGGLAAPRRRAGEHVTPDERVWDGFRLNGGRAYEAQALDASNEGRVQLESMK